jgi:hypothetical protein
LNQADERRNDCSLLPALLLLQARVSRPPTSHQTIPHLTGIIPEKISSREFPAAVSTRKRHSALSMPRVRE